MSLPGPETHRDRPAGELLGGRYELLEPIGHGGMSTVYRAHDRSLDRAVAIKLIWHDPDTHGDVEQLRARFRREAANAARIPPHPNVVQIYDYGSDPEGHQDFIVMELLRGEDLKAALRRQRFGTSEAVRIILEAARGLAAGHRAGIVHRDVKPANILLAENGAERKARILDFGIAKAMAGAPDEDLTRIGDVPHTPAYASPEQRVAGGSLTPASDVYQLGLVSYELLTGERAFTASDRERIAKGEPVWLTGGGGWDAIPPPVRGVVERALRPAPEERYPDAGAFAAALAAAAEDDGTLLASYPPDDATAVMDGAAPSPESRPTRTRAISGWWADLPGGARIALIGISAVLLAWAALRVGSGTSADDADGSATPTPAELEERFAPVYGDAADWIAEQSGEASRSSR